MSQQNWRNIYFTSDDGLRLYARDYGPFDGKYPAVLCLAGLTRNSKDFHHVASRLALSRRVIVPDYRGRGLSEYASDWQTYQPHIEMADALKLLDHSGIDKFSVIGTSRGGLISMVMGQTIKDRLAGVVLNDIGPKLDDDGLIRIADAIAKRTEHKDWREVADSLKDYSIGFSGLSDANWLEFAQNLYREKDGKIEADYDANLMKTFPDADFIRSGRIPQAWDMFESFAGLPVGVIRGQHSDLLSSETVEKMKQTHEGLITTTVPNRAHVPFLDEPETVEVIDKVLGC